MIKEGCTTIYEAAFIYDKTLIYVDILHKDMDGWKAYEVKSSIRISEIYLKDACLQYYVLKNCLPGFEDLFLVNINSNYVLENEMDIKKLFITSGISFY